MRFAPAIAKSPKTGILLPVWLPDVHSVNPGFHRTDRLLTARVGDRHRVLATRLVDMAVGFNRTLERREQLGHDCAVFALACETDDPHFETPFNQGGGKIVKIGLLDYEAVGRQREEEPATTPGEITFTTSTDLSPGKPLADPHFLVKVSTDGGIPLYLSKLGTAEPVVLSTYESMAAMYDVTTTGTAHGFHTQAYEQL